MLPLRRQQQRFNYTGHDKLRPHHVYHASHGSPTSFSLPGGSYGTGHFMALTNISSGNLPAIWNSISCLIGALDHSSDCMGDAWLNSPNGGGFGGFNARYGWGSPSSPGNGASEVLCQALYDVHWNDGQNTLGAMHFIGRDQMNPGSNQVMDWCVKNYNLFGEPELPIWTEEAVDLTVTHPASITGSSNVTVNVTAEGSPVSGAGFASTRATTGPQPRCTRWPSPAVPARLRYR